MSLEINRSQFAGYCPRSVYAHSASFNLSGSEIAVSLIPKVNRHSDCSILENHKIIRASVLIYVFICSVFRAFVDPISAGGFDLKKNSIDLPILDFIYVLFSSTAIQIWEYQRRLPGPTGNREQTSFSER